MIIGVVVGNKVDGIILPCKPAGGNCGEAFSLSRVEPFAIFIVKIAPGAVKCESNIFAKRFAIGKLRSDVDYSGGMDGFSIGSSKSMRGLASAKTSGIRVGSGVGRGS